MKNKTKIVQDWIDGIFVGHYPKKVLTIETASKEFRKKSGLEHATGYAIALTPEKEDILKSVSNKYNVKYDLLFNMLTR